VDGSFYWACLKKVVIADNLAIVVDAVFQSPATPDGITCLLAMYAFAIQIYCDFSGYSDIARGLSKLMVIEIMQNFSIPYFSRNPREFWQRWHISLSTWLRDYLYIPLGGKPPWFHPYLSQSDDHHASGGTVAWGRLDLHLVGCLPWHLSCGPQVLFRRAPHSFS
jgi:D-alanyl-lipoteichoic acid acyltransferase DltB (MBOAT superfamily)